MLAPDFTLVLCGQIPSWLIFGVFHKELSTVMLVTCDPTDQTQLDTSCLHETLPGASGLHSLAVFFSTSLILGSLEQLRNFLKNLKELWFMQGAIYCSPLISVTSRLQPLKVSGVFKDNVKCCNEIVLIFQTTHEHLGDQASRGRCSKRALLSLLP